MSNVINDMGSILKDILQYTPQMTGFMSRVEDIVPAWASVTTNYRKLPYFEITQEQKEFFENISYKFIFRDPEGSGNNVAIYMVNNIVFRIKPKL